MFQVLTLSFEPDMFHHLKTIQLEKLGPGRIGGVLVSPHNNLIPIVRTTTVYHQPSLIFQSIHHQIVQQIKKHAHTDRDDAGADVGADVSFNNALIEIYNDEYKKMGFHSDSSLDLEPNSYIALYSCYQNPDTPNRALTIKNKLTGTTQQIILQNNSVVLFSTTTNQLFQHKIDYIQTITTHPQQWLGITFRKSHTFLQFDSIGDPIIHSGLSPHCTGPKCLKLASHDEKQMFYQEKAKENTTTTHQYPSINFTLSPSDLLIPATESLN